MTGNRRSFQALRDPWMLVLVGAALFFGRTFTDGASTPPPSNEYRVAAKNIEDFRCGDRMLGRNPLRHEVDDFPDPTPESHRLLTLRMRKGDTSTLHIRLLRTLEWIDLAEAGVGRTVDLYLPEMGAVGPAEVLDINPCPPIAGGPGNVVTGTFRHDADNVIVVQLEGDIEPIGCTSNHRFWSEDRQDFVEAGELQPQERVRTRLAGIIRVASSTPKPGTHTVYNVEIHGEHVYEVSSVGALVHNTYPTRFHKRTVKQVARMRHTFDKSGGVRERFLKRLARQSDAVEKYGDEAVELMKQGIAPPDRVVHHMKPLFRGGTNSFDNLMLMDREYHVTHSKLLHWYEEGMNPFGKN